MHILVIKGIRRWFWKIIGSNGQIVAVSQKYASKWSAKRTARKLAKTNKMELREADDRG